MAGSSLLAFHESIDKLHELSAAYLPPELLQHLQNWWTVAHPVIHKASRDAAAACDPAVQRILAVVNEGIIHVNDHLATYQPYQAALLGAAAAMLLLLLLRVVLAALSALRSHSLVQTICTAARKLPFLHGKVAQMRRKAAREVAEKLQRTDTIITSLPPAGQTPAAVLAKLKHFQSRDTQIADGHSSLSGVIYMQSQEHKRLLDDAYSLFSSSNPLHADAFPSVRQMEAEVVAMTASILGGGPDGDTNVCGAMTSGGTESILSAMMASRNYMCAKRRIKHPEIIIGTSAHAAYFKAAEYFGLRLVRLPLDSGHRLTARAVARAITRNTVVVVASAVSFPHGVLDHITDIAAVARRKGVCLHVDACLGGFLLPFARQLGRPVPDFNFAVPGVTSMSVDTHKFGMAPKGSSVVLYRSPEIRRNQYTAITDWSGGPYISPGMAGSRSGGLVAAAWASLVCLGAGGLRDAAHRCLTASDEFQAGIRAIPELQLVGQPDMSVVAFTTTSSKLNVYVLNDLMAQKGWHLNTLQFPAALHFCFTSQHTQVVPDLLRDLRECVVALKQQKGGVQGGSAPVYGMVASLPDRELVGDFLVDFQDVLLAP